MYKLGFKYFRRVFVPKIAVHDGPRERHKQGEQADVRDNLSAHVDMLDVFKIKQTKKQTKKRL